MNRTNINQPTVNDLLDFGQQIAILPMEGRHAVMELSRMHVEYLRTGIEPEKPAWVPAELWDEMLASR